MRPQVFLIITLIVMALFAVFPQIDLMVSARFYDAEKGGFYLGNAAWVGLASKASNGMVLLFLLGVVAAYGVRKIRPEYMPWMHGRLLAYFLLVFVLGPVLLVSYGFKDHWGRARPMDVAAFGGTQHFTPYYQPTNQCESDCAFPSGHTARGFYFLTVVMAIWGAGLSARARWVVLLGALAFGCMAAGTRLIEGKHFLSDVTTSALVMGWLSWVFYRWVTGRLAQR